MFVYYVFVERTGTWNWKRRTPSGRAQNSKVSSKRHKLSRIYRGGNLSSEINFGEIITHDCALTTLGVALTLAQDLVAAALVDCHGTLGATVALFSKSPGKGDRRVLEE